VFQWSARFPLLAVAIDQDRLEAAAEHAHRMLDNTQQPLLPDVRKALEDAIPAGSRDAYRPAVDVARKYGYT
jgi:hypothetical protein